MSKKFSWFKHYNNSSKGHTMALLWAAKDYETIAFYWWLLEALSRWEKDDNRGQVILSYRIIKQEVGWNRQRTDKVLLKIAQTFKMKVDPICDETFALYVHNWSELQGRPGLKEGQKIGERSGEVRGKRLEVRGEIKNNTYAQQVERIYQEIYPRKRGKTKGIKKLASEVRTDAQLAELEKAVRNYASSVAGSDPQFILHFSTFASSWRDWIVVVPDKILSAPVKYNQAAVFDDDDEDETPHDPEAARKVREFINARLKGIS